MGTSHPEIVFNGMYLDLIPLIICPYLWCLCQYILYFLQWLWYSSFLQIMSCSCLVTARVCCVLNWIFLCKAWIIVTPRFCTSCHWYECLELTYIQFCSNWSTPFNAVFYQFSDRIIYIRFIFYQADLIVGKQGRQSVSSKNYIHTCVYISVKYQYGIF